MSEPIFKAIFKQSWDELPVALKRHYSNRPRSNDITRTTGIMDVHSCLAVRILSPLLKYFGLMPPYSESGILVSVNFKSNKSDDGFTLDRDFHFTGKTHPFHSTMYHLGDNKIIEKMAHGICWKAKYSWDESKVQIQHDGYAFHFKNTVFNLPVTWLVGKGHAVERAISDDRFAMEMTLTHALWGVIYRYKGIFTILETTNEGVY